MKLNFSSLTGAISDRTDNNWVLSTRRLAKQLQIYQAPCMLLDTLAANLGLPNLLSLVDRSSRHSTSAGHAGVYGRSAAAAAAAAYK